MQARAKIRVLIIDDEAPAREAIKLYMKENEAFEVIAECSDGLTALASIETHQPDLLLLDIEMPELNGIELVQKLKSPTPYIVFITAFHHYAVQAFEENAIDYLLKPFDRSRFEKMLSKVVSQIGEKEPVSLQLLANSLSKIKEAEDEKYLRKIPVKRKGKVLFIPVEKIIWIESSGSITKLHLEGSIEISNSSIGQLEQQLDPTQHIRIHKSHIINLDQVNSMESYFHGEYIITLNSGVDLKLSRSYKGMLDRIMNQYKP